TIPSIPWRRRGLTVAACQLLPPPPEGPVLQPFAPAEVADGQPAPLLVPDRPPPEPLTGGVTSLAATSGHAGVSSAPTGSSEGIVPWPSRWGWYDAYRMSLALEPFRAVLRLFGHGSRFVQVGPRLPPALPCPRLPPPRAVADAMVGDYRQQRIDQRRPTLRSRRLELRRERPHRLLRPREAHLPRPDPMLGRRHGHHRP